MCKIIILSIEIQISSKINVYQFGTLFEKAYICKLKCR
jgi:hypothetical protein